MYLCICRAVKQSEVDQAIENGWISFRDISDQTECSKDCGQCAKSIKEYIQTKTSNANVHASSQLDSDSKSLAI